MLAIVSESIDSFVSEKACLHIRLGEVACDNYIVPGYGGV